MNHARAETPDASRPHASAARIESLDVFRGLSVIAMMLVDWPGSWSLPRFDLFEHAHWLGIGPPDFIFPMFIFIIGVTIPFSLSAKQQAGMSPAQLRLRILRRVIVCFSLGYLVNLEESLDHFTGISEVRLLGILQRDALVYPFAAFFYLRLPLRWLAPLAAGILLAYWAVMTLVPVPGFGAPNLAQYPVGETTPNLAAWIDKTVLGHSAYEYPFEPEGLLNTLPAIALVLIGILAGQRLRDEPGLARVSAQLLAWGVALAALGYFWSFWFPWAKKMWTSSFVLFMAGCGLVFLAAIVWIIDVRRYRGPLLLPARWFGRNALAAYVIFSVLDDIMDSVGIKEVLFDRLFRSWLPDKHASWVYSVVAISLLAVAFRSLDRRKLYLKA